MSSKFLSPEVITLSEVYSVDSWSRYIPGQGMAPSPIQERFICFETVKDSTGKELSPKTESILEKEELDLENCRRQEYDIGTNMRGLI
ncbi:hypothetical protein AVEN_70297-1 [Araneus ventricosus]|uniref:Uncharacterized protein n=1 Tax=Araneus ventricosus TaxID=182803 RepID=A0A4Y2KGY5_ARAVE|nr:hypothetical protein AVEN_70297-1 [Araneus ventricosus]